MKPLRFIHHTVKTIGKLPFEFDRFYSEWYRRMIIGIGINLKELIKKQTLNDKS